MSIFGVDKTKPLVVVDADSLVGVDFRNLDLESADFQRVDLRNCDFRGSRLSGCMLTFANLSGADFSGCDLSRAHFHAADLSGAILDGITIDWFSAPLVNALLQQAAKTNARKEFAVHGLHRRLCSDELLALNHSEADWAIRVLAPYVKDGDKAPAFLRDAANLTI
jgi:uncharacterized protein YjbI with pentapeptide repeats